MNVERKNIPPSSSIPEWWEDYCWGYDIICWDIISGY